MEVINVKIDTLLPSEYNPREITDRDFVSLKKSIKEFGFVEPLIVNKKNVLVGGHMRWRAAKELGLTEVPVFYVDLTPEKEKILNLALNRIVGRWDYDKLEEMVFELGKVEDLDLSIAGFEDWELEMYNPGPTSEIKNINEAAEWVGMPDYQIMSDPLKVIVSFDNEKDKIDFFKVIGQKYTEKIKSIWFPFRKKDDTASIKFE